MKTKNLKLLLAKRLIKDIFANLGELCALMAKDPLPMRKKYEWQNPDFFATPPASHVQNVQEMQAAQEPQAVAQPQKAAQAQEFQRKKPDARQISTYARVR